jgi:hypothetical protein
MTIDKALKEWKSKRRTMGCVAATEWFCKRVSGFYPERLKRYTVVGEMYQHVIATDGFVRIDLAPYADKPRTITLELELWDAWIGEGNSKKYTFKEWVNEMADNDKGILQDAAKEYLGLMS